MVSFSLAAFLLAAAISAPGAPSPAPMTAPMSVRVFSDVCRDAESHALQGTRILLLHTFDGDVVLFQHAVAGPFDSPAAARANINSRTGAVSFAIKSGDYDMSFAGAISGEQLKGTLHWRSPPEDDDVILTLARKSERIASCRPGPL